MKDAYKSKKQLVAELAELRRRVTELEVAGSERERVYEALRQSEERYRAVAESEVVGIAITDPKENLVFGNPAFAKMLGYSQSELMGINLSKLADPTEFAKYRDQTVARKEGRHSHYETTLRRKDGGILNILVSASPLTAQDGGFLGTLGVIVDITERKQVEGALLRRHAQLEALQQVGLEISAQLDLDILLHSIVSWAAELLEGVAGGLYLYRPEQDAMEWSVFVGPDSVAPVGTIIHRGEGLCGKVWEAGRPLIVNDYGRWEGQAASWEEHPVAAIVGVPISCGEEFLGVLEVATDVQRAFSRADADLLVLFANQAAIAIRNARLYEAVQRELVERRRTEKLLERRASQLALINDTGQEITAVLELDSLLDRAVQLLSERFGYDHLTFMTVDRGQEELVMRSRRGPMAQVLRRGHRMKLGEGMTGWVGRHGKTLLANDVNAEPRYVNPFPDVIKTQSELVVPIRMGQKILGVLDIQSPQTNAFDENDVMVLETLANQIAVAIENARLYEAVRQELAERKQAEEALQRAYEDVERKVEERTAALMREMSRRKQLEVAQAHLKQEIIEAQRRALL